MSWLAVTVMRRILLGVVLLALGACAGTPAVSESARSPGAQSFAADAHVHLTMAKAATPLFAGEPGDGQLARSPRTRLVNQVDEAQLRASGVGVLFAALWPPLGFRPGLSGLDEALRQVELLEDFSARRPAFAVVHDVRGARRALRSGRLAVFAHVEGGEGISSVDDVDRYYAAGVRGVTLVHFISNAMAGASRGQLERTYLGLGLGARSDDGLTPLGQAAVERMTELGMVIDVSHASDRTIEAVLAITEARGVPILASHTGARALLDLERNLSDLLARRIAASGGLIGVTLFEAQLGTPPELGADGHHRGTCDDAVAHWRHFASVVPPEALVLGSDFNGYTVRPGPGGACPHGIRHAGDLGALWAALVADGHPQASLDSMSERLLQFVARVEARASPSARAQALRLTAAPRRTAW